jgi:hypothetical protein
MHLEEPMDSDKAMNERAAVVAWLRTAADTQEAAAVALANTIGTKNAFYNADASVRYRAAADAIEAGDHLGGQSDAE